MREATFIKRNTPKWRNYEENPSEPSSDPDELTDRYIELTDDLSYARTFYPDSNVTKYLNSAASRMHRGLCRINATFKIGSSYSGRTNCRWRFGNRTGCY